jgi:hypothetical protein
MSESNRYLLRVLRSSVVKGSPEFCLVKLVQKPIYYLTTYFS